MNQSISELLSLISVIIQCGSHRSTAGIATVKAKSANSRFGLPIGTDVRWKPAFVFLTVHRGLIQISLSNCFRPHDTPFEDGTFKLTIEFTEEYPNKPPTVRFVSKMFHPNVYADGGICLDILQNRWSPTYDVSAILTSIQVSTYSCFNICSPEELALFFKEEKIGTYDYLQRCACLNTTRYMWWEKIISRISRIVPFVGELCVF